MKLYNSCSKTNEIFEPNLSGKVSIYVCGITPYDVTHLGHAATYIFFDALIRYLTFLGYQVEYTQNVTDIDDDILKKAKNTKGDWKELGEYWTKFFRQDMQTLNALSPTHYVKATDSINKIVEIASSLEKKGLAYAKEGNVYFDVRKFKAYGQLSHYNRDQMIALSRERGANPKDPLKNDPLDFLLWQRSKKGEPSWDSPWSKGRPGWHIECSAMIHETLGSQIDIHGGGLDLIYPHHESEIAQSESYTGKAPFVKYWLHTAMVMHLGEKMSKSLGNLVLARDLLKKYSPNAIRFLLLSYHYRQPWEFDETRLDWASERVRQIENVLARQPSLQNGSGGDKAAFKKFESLMDDDMNTPDVLSLMTTLTKRGDTDSLETVSEVWKILGFVI